MAVNNFDSNSFQESFEDETMQAEDSYAPITTPDATPHASSNNNHNNSSSAKGNGTKLFVGGIALTVTSDALTGFCSRYGEVLNAHVCIDKPTGRSRGFGFVTFKDQSAATAMVRDQPIIEGKQVEAKLAVTVNPGESFSRKFSPSDYMPGKIFVGGLPPTVDEAKLKEYFTKYGTVSDTVIVKDKANGDRHKGFGFVRFENQCSVELAIIDAKLHIIDEKWVEVKRCESRQPPQFIPSPMMPHMNFFPSYNNIKGAPYKQNAHPPPSAHYGNPHQWYDPRGHTHSQPHYNNNNMHHNYKHDNHQYNTHQSHPRRAAPS